MVQRTKTRQRGAGYIEVLVSSLILSLSLLAALSLYGFSMNLIDKTGDEGVAYNIARKALENAREAGFSGVNLPEGTLTLYYDSVGTSEGGTQQSTSRFRMLRTVTSDKHVIGSTNPAPNAVRSVVIEVSYVGSGDVIERTGTVLVRSGV
jgi:hypothetical protein